MRIRRLRLHTVRLPFRFAYRHALADRSEASTLIVEAVTDDGVCGWGECIPREYLTGETIDSVRTDLADRFWPDVRELSFDSMPTALSTLRPVYESADADRRTAAYAGLEIAILDALGRAVGEPLRAAVPAEDRGRAQPIRYTGPVGGGSVRACVRLARLFRWTGFREVKLKLGADDDADRLAAVRHAIGPDIDLRVDANTAWDAQAALARREALRACRVSSAEQPVPARDIEGMAHVARESGLPVMADESLCTTADARALIGAEACRIFNLRLAKCGGFSGCLAHLRMARKAGLDAQLGALVGETAVLTAAGQELLAATGPLRHHETSFPDLFLQSDPARGACRPGLGGVAPVRPPRPGLGVTVDRTALRCYATAFRECD